MKFKCREHIKECANYGNIIYHRECYQGITNRANLQRLEPFRVRLMKILAMNLKKIENIPDKEGKSLSSKSTLYDKTKCIICQVPEVKLGMISVKETGEKNA